jgi:hypothetical protein
LKSSLQRINLVAIGSRPEHVAIGEATRVMRGPVLILNGRRQDASKLLAIGGICEEVSCPGDSVAAY